MGIISQNAKHNQSSRIDELGTLRHKNVNLCGVGAVGFHLFAVYHIANISPPSFVPDFSDTAKAEGYGVYRKRPWYQHTLFSGQKDGTEMEPSSKRNRLIYS